MNKDQKKRITQNITYLKERLIDLDPIIDILIERDIFSMEYRIRIEQVAQPTPQRKFNEFIQILLSCPDPNTYDTFVEALSIERHHPIVDRLHNTIVKDGPGYSYVAKQAGVPGNIRLSNRQSTFHGSTISQREDASGAAGGQRSVRFDPMVDTMQRVLGDFCSKLTDEIVNKMDQKHQEEQQALERKMEERLQQFGEEWHRDKEDMLRRNETAINELQSYVLKLKSASDEYDKLKEKYEFLKTQQEDLRERENDRWQKLTNSNMENVHLQKENKNLRLEVKSLQERLRDQNNDLQVARDNERQDRNQIEGLTTENASLLLQLKEKEQENAELKKELESAYEKIRHSVEEQREKSSTDDATYIDALSKQFEKLNEIHAAVSDLSSRERAPRPSTRGLCMYGNAIQRGTKTTNSKPGSYK